MTTVGLLRTPLLADRSDMDHTGETMQKIKARAPSWRRRCDEPDCEESGVECGS
jgi:hypothetical protein